MTRLTERKCAPCATGTPPLADAEVKRLLADYGYHTYRYDGARIHDVTVSERHAGEDLLALSAHHFARHPTLMRLR